MGKIVRVNVNPKVLLWARESLGLDIGFSAKKIGVMVSDLERWEGGEPILLGKLKKAAEVYKRPIAIFFLPTVPADLKPLPDFRRLPETMGNALSPAARLQIRKTYNRQRTAMELSREGNWSHSGSVSQNDSPEVVSVRIANLLQLRHEEWDSEYDAFNHRRMAVERLGVLVFLITGVKLQELRGFSISNPARPVIALNRSDKPKPSSFRMLHELCHLLIGQSGLCDISEIDYKNTPASWLTETFCNHVAGAVLVPADKLRRHPCVQSHAAEPEWSSADLLTLSNYFMVSQEAILRRLLILEKTTAEFYKTWRQNYAPQEKPRGSAPKERAFQKALRTQGESYVRLVLEALHENAITLTRASDYLELKVPQIYDLETALESR